jgi:hypothetical protein
MKSKSKTIDLILFKKNLVTINQDSKLGSYLMLLLESTLISF